MLQKMRDLGSGASKYGRKWRVNVRSTDLTVSVLIDIREMLEEIEHNQQEILRRTPPPATDLPQQLPKWGG